MRTGCESSIIGCDPTLSDFVWVIGAFMLIEAALMMPTLWIIFRPMDALSERWPGTEYLYIVPGIIMALGANLTMSCYVLSVVFR